MLFVLFEGYDYVQMDCVSFTQAEGTLPESAVMVAQALGKFKLPSSFTGTGSASSLSVEIAFPISSRNCPNAFPYLNIFECAYFLVIRVSDTMGE